MFSGFAFLPRLEIIESSSINFWAVYDSRKVKPDWKRLFTLACHALYEELPPCGYSGATEANCGKRRSRKYAGIVLVASVPTPIRPKNGFGTWLSKLDPCAAWAGVSWVKLMMASPAGISCTP